jgi:hypothetical protein
MGYRSNPMKILVVKRYRLEEARKSFFWGLAGAWVSVIFSAAFN